MRSLSLALGALCLNAPLLAQGNDCNPDSDSREAQLFAHFSVPLAFSPAQSPWIYRPGSVHISVEGTYLPDASDRIATPTSCRPGKGPENVNLLTAFPRPRVGFALGDGVLLEASWIPPVRINGVRTNLWGLALSRSVLLDQKGTMFMGRAHATLGNVRAPFTCPKEATQDPANVDCFGGGESDDRYSPNIFGVELGFGWALAQGRLRPYLGTGYNILHPRFQVNRVVDAIGTEDHQKVEVNLSRWTLFGGITWQPSMAFQLSTEAYSAPSDLITARVKGTVIVGGRRKVRG